ncbi:hypothetical protein N7495_001072 [Penicillium taxi]|uniref:uncharacterized protein n=1 Tax=Penicillium taxi TaxID=168475 RepID=UPI0025459712|nr:uncharacterized protein N7495_001072 [Penicillium taxi]KAJ5908390.1 hypothetical protein N7495_001072 [Penicillium taxi]
MTGATSRVGSPTAPMARDTILAANLTTARTLQILNKCPPPPPTQPKDVAESSHPSIEFPVLQPIPSSTPINPTPQPQQAPPQVAHEVVFRPPPGPPPPYDYEVVTDSIVKEWLSTGKGKVVEEGKLVQSNQDGRLSLIYQELIQSTIYCRLSPSEAGSTVKQIIGENEDVDMDDMEKNGIFSDPRSIFLDTLSSVTDADTSNPIFRPLISATGISPALMRIHLETPLLQNLGLVRETFARMGIRKQTNLLYRQSNYNLLREESEGYSKLLTELFTTSNNEPPSSEVVEDTFERVKAMIGAFDMDVGRVLDVTLDVFAAVLVKQYRFFVKLLRASSWWPVEDTLPKLDLHECNSGLPTWALPGSSGWFTTEEDRAVILKFNEERDRKFWDRVRQVGIQAFFEVGRKSLSEEDKHTSFETSGLPAIADATQAWIEATGTMPPKGNRVAAQLLGLKLRFYSSTARSKSDTLPDNLIYLAALLIKVGFISLRDLYAHLWRPDDSMDKLKMEKMTEKTERDKAARHGGSANALMMAGALSDDTLPVPRIRESESRATPGKDADVKAEDDLPDPSDQKVLLLKSLLAIGAIPESLFIISKFPWLMDLYPELPEFIHRILHHSLSKVYTPLRPLSSMETFPGEKQVVSTEQSGVAKGHIRLSNPSARRSLRWAQLDKEDTNDGTDYRFYWDDWSDSIPICQSVDDVFALCSSFLNLSGHRIGEDASLLTKLARIGKHSLSQDGSEENRTRWGDLCKRLLLPSISLTKNNPGVVNEIFELISFFPRHVRYNMYGEWSSGQTSRLPVIKAAFDQARAATKDVLKRLSKTNIRPMARLLAKIAYANPGIVINVAISQIESYENLIECVVECARYFTNLGYDITTWALIDSLGQKGRSRTQESGLLTSKWLNALSTFTGRIFKRYSVMDPGPVLQYVVEQLRQNNSADLIILEQIVTSMAGIISDTNFNETQIHAMGGGEILQSQIILEWLDKRHESKITSKRLLKSLTHTRMAGQLLVAISQERLTCVYDESCSELKLLGNIFDEIHRILTQYLDFLRSSLSVDDFDSFVPDLATLIKDFGIQPEIAFWIRRASVSQKIANYEQSKQKTELSTTKDTVVATDAASDIFSLNPVVQEFIETVKDALPSEYWEVVGVHFFATFWQLSLYDVTMPQKSYEDEVEKLRRRIVAINNDRSDISMVASQRKEREKKQITQLQDRIFEENKSHLAAYQQTRTRLQKEKDRWFAGMRLKSDNLNVALLEQCFIPRLLLSPIEAFFSFKMLKWLHSSGTPYFRTVGLIDQLFREHRLAALIFICTSKEADNLGQFLNHILCDLARWHADKGVYEKEAFGTKRDLAGFAPTVDSEGAPVKFIEFEDFRRLLYKWHRHLCSALKTCLNGGEYMHIRNAISVLRAVVETFPAVNWIGDHLLKCVKDLSQNDERADVKISAASLIGHLNQKEKKWILPQAFHLPMVQPDAGQSKSGSQPPGTPQPRSFTPTPLNATAAEFQPGKQDAADPSKQASGKTEVEDGEIEDAKMVDVASAKDVNDAEPVSDGGSAHATTDTGVASYSGGLLESEQRGQAEPPSRPRPNPRALDSARPADIPKRPDTERGSINPREQALRPRITENRLPPRPDLLEDRRDRLSDFNPRTRHGLPEHGRFDGSGVDGRGPVHGRDRDFGMRPTPDDPMRGPPYREGRLPREPEWPAGPGRHSFHGREGPIRGELLPDRTIEGPRRGEKEDRRPFPPSSLPPRSSDLPNRPERFPDEHRSVNFPQQPPRHEEFPRGPRDRSGGEPRDAGMSSDMTHGRPRQPELLHDIPSGPRMRNGRGARNAPVAPSMNNTNNGNVATAERQLPTGPGRQGGRVAPEQPSATQPSPSQPSSSAGADTSGVHPDRLTRIIQQPSSQQTPSQVPSGPMTPPSGPRGASSGQQGGRGPGERGRGDKRFAAINNVLTQGNSPVDRVGAAPSIRGRGATRQLNNADDSPQTSARPPNGPDASRDGSQQRGRASGRGGDLIDDTGSETRRSGRNNDRGRENERDRRGDESANGSKPNGSRREERRERDRNRRSDVGSGTAREEKDRERHAESREAMRRNPSSREEMRRRDRRDREDLKDNADNDGRLHQASTMGPPSSHPAPPPPPPPPAPPALPTDDNGRRWGAGNRPENRDRERERRGERDRRERRESGRNKRRLPNQEDNSQMGTENKRPRRGM